MKPFVISFIFLFFVASCKEAKEEAIDLSEIIGKSERYNEDSLLVKENVEEDTLIDVLIHFKQIGVEVDSVQPIVNPMFPDRFGAYNTEKYQLFNKENNFKYYSWSFADSASTINAFYNWIDCFGDKCKSIYIGEERVFQTNPFQIFVGDTSIVFVEADKSFDFNYWTKNLQNSGFTTSWYYVVEQRRLGKARWYSYVDELKSKIEK